MRLFVCVLLICFVTVSALTQSNPAASTKTLAITETNANLLDKLRDYPNLEVLSITCLEGLQSLPDSIGGLTKLRELTIDNDKECSMNPALPETIGNLRALEKLVLYGAQDPRPVGHHYGPQPTERHNFPSSMSRLKNLTYLDLGRNGLEEVPSFIRNLPNLRELGLEWNMKLTTVPEFLTSLRELRTLRLEANDFEDLPDFLNELPNLTEITLGYNCKITQNGSKMKSLETRFPRITFDFTDEYDCPAK
jgi:Leucine-rich repeat (LRR) protein